MVFKNQFTNQHYSDGCVNPGDHVVAMVSKGADETGVRIQNPNYCYYNGQPLYIDETITVSVTAV